MDLNIDNLSDQQIADHLAQSEASTTVETTDEAPNPAPVSTVVDTPATEQADQQLGEAGQSAPAAAPVEGTQQPQQPDADRRVPVSEHIEMRRRAQVAEQERDALRAQQAQSQQQQRYAQEEAEYNRLLAEHGPEAAGAYASQVNARRQAEASQAQAEAQRAQQQTVINQHIDIGERYAVERYGLEEYNRQASKVVDKLGAQTVMQMAQERAAKGENPAEWLYQLGKSMLTPDEVKAQNKAEIDAAVQEALKKYNPNPQTPGGGGVHTIPASTQAAQLPDPDQMTDEELAAAVRARG